MPARITIDAVVTVMYAVLHVNGNFKLIRPYRVPTGLFYDDDDDNNAAYILPITALRKYSIWA